MKFTVKKAELSSALKKIGAIATNKTPTNHNNFSISTEEKGFIKVIANDGYSSGEVYVMATILEEGKASINAQKLLNIVDTFKEEILFEEIGSKLVILEAKTKFKLDLSDLEVFTKELKFNDAIEFNINGQLIRKIFEKTISFVEPKSTSVIKGISLKFKDNKIQACATDGNFLSCASVDFETTIENSIIIDANFVKSIIKNLDENEVNIKFDNSLIEFNFTNCSISTGLIDGKYPPYEQFFKAEKSNKLEVSKENIQNVLKKIGAVKNDKNKITIETGLLNTIKYQDMLEDTIEAVYTGDNLSINFNCDYLAKIIDNIDAENVVIEMGNELDAAFIKDENLIMLIMPIR